MAAHAQVTDVVEEDSAGGAGCIDRVTKECAHDDIGAARLVHDGRPEAVVETLKAFQTLGKGTVAEVGTAREDESRRLPSCMGVKNGDAD
jgi:hypothetical protein